MKHSYHTRIIAFFRARSGMILAALGACLALLLGSLAIAAPAPQQAAQHTLYVPLLQNNRGTNQPPPPPPPPAAGAFFLNTQIANGSADIAIDSRGGMHAAYRHVVPTNENPRAIYTFCTAGAAACANPAAWQSVVLSGAVREVQLGLTAAGQPRLLIVTDAANMGVEHAYAACDQNCTTVSAWTITSVVTAYNASEILELDEPQRSFAIAPDGRAAFIYNDRNYQYAEPDLYGAYYAECVQQCADPANWERTPLSMIYSGGYQFDYEVFKFPALTFTAQSEPRFLARVFALNLDGSAAPEGLYYYACDGGCNDRANWQRAFLVAAGSGVAPYPGWDLALTSDGRPRGAAFMGTGFTPDSINNRLLYLFCEQNCLDGDNWGFNFVLANQGTGMAPDIEIDAQNRPRIAWINESGDLGYAWCNSTCEQYPTAPWQSKIVETEAALKQEHPQAIPTNCDTDAWNGLAPVLALDAAGNPRIVYDVAVKARCYYTDPTRPADPPEYRFEPIWRGVHLAHFTQP